MKIVLGSRGDNIIDYGEDVRYIIDERKFKEEEDNELFGWV